MKKVFSKFISIVLAIVFVFGAMPLAGVVGIELPEFNLFSTKAKASETSGYYRYTVSNREATITVVSTSISGSVTIPETLGGYPVTSIGYQAFYNCTGLTNVTIGNSVTSIGDKAFEDCTGLTSATIPDSVTSIGEDAFYGTGIYKDSSNWKNDVLYIGNHIIQAKTTLSGDYEIEEGTKTIAGRAFYLCKGLTSVTIPQSVTNIGHHAFSACTGLTSVTIPYSVTNIGNYAFSACKDLTSVTIPDSVTSIGDSAFKGCAGLTIVTISDSVTSIGVDAFYRTGIYNDSSNWKNDVLYIGNHIINAKDTLSGDYEIEEGTKTIADGAFPGCTGLTSVTIPESVTSIGDSAFIGCTGLTSITIPESVTSIGDYAFKGCTGLESITMSDSVTSIGDYAFDKCAVLKEAYFDGNAEEWAKISNGTGNWYLTILTVYFSEYKVSWVFGNETVDEYVEVGNELTPPSISEKTGYSFVGWTPEIPDTMPAKDLLFTAVFTANSYDATFNANGGKWSDGLTKKIVPTDFDSQIVAPEPPSRLGYSFAGWDPKVGTMDDVNGKEFFAKWTINSYNAVFNANGGKWSDDATIKTVSTDYSSQIVAPENPSRQGYDFAGWDSEIGIMDDVSGKEFFAKWTINSYDAVFNANGGEWSDRETTKTVATDFDSEIIAPENPSRQGYDFAGWSPSVGIMDDVNGKAFSAQWVAKNDTKYTVETYTMNAEGKYVKTVQNYTGETDSTANAEYTVAKGFTLNEEKSVLSGVISADNSLVLKVYIDRNKYTFTSIVDGEATETEYLYGSIIAEPATPIKTGYTFTGWDKTIPATMPAEDFTVTARFTANSYDAVFNANGGTWSSGATTKTVSTNFDSEIIAPENPSRQGYDFAGWDSEIGKMDDVNGKTFSAKWTARNDTIYTVETYTMDIYGKYSVVKETKKGTTDTEASVTANAQHGFTINSAKSKLSGNIAGDGSLVLSVYYDRITYRLTTVVEGQTTSSSYYFDAPVTMPANPVKPGYKFIGWDKTIPSKMPANDVTVTAVFEQILLKMSIRNPSTTTIKYGDKIILHADMNEALPSGWTVKWTADNGNFSYSVSADGSTCTISPSKSGSTNFKATVYDEKGNVICEDTQSMTSKAGFFDKIGAFFRKLFGSAKTIPQLFKGIF